MLPYIGCFPSDFTAGLGVKFCNSFVDSALVASADRHLRAFCEQHLRDGAADSSSRTGDKADFVGHMRSSIRPANARVSAVSVVNKIFWSLAALEAVFFVAAFILTAMEGGPNPNGGKGMALIFQIAVPF